MAALTTSKAPLLGHLISQSAGIPCLGVASRYYSDNVKFLKSLDTASIKRGRGGRSSFSGIVCTIFGGSGFIGRYIANRLGKKGCQMIFPYRGDFYDQRHLKVAGDLGQVLFTPYHLCDEASIAKAVKYSDVVINLVGRDWPTRNFSLEQVHVEGASRIARVCKQSGVEKFIHVSALNANRDYEGYYIPGGSPLLAAKGAGEEAVRKEFPEAVIFRPSDVWGPDDRFLRYFGQAYRSDFRTLALPKGGYDIYKQPVFVGDLAQAIVTVAMKEMNAEGKVFQAVGPRRYEVREMIEWFLRVLRRGPEVNTNTDIVDMKYFPLTLLKAKINELLPSFPINSITTDKLERETVTDVVSRHLPTLEDLGVELTKLEDRIEWELRPFRQFESFEEELGDFPAPAPPKFIQP